MWLTYMLVVLILIGINALYVAAEFSAISVRRGRLSQMAEKGWTVAGKFLKHIETPRKLDEYVAACQIGITWSSIFLGAYAQATIAMDAVPLLTDAFAIRETRALLIASLTTLFVSSCVQVVFGELVPKSIAMQYPAITGIVTLYPMKVSIRLYAWFIAFLNGSAWFLLKNTRFRMREEYSHIHSPEEIAYMVEESREVGLIQPRAYQQMMQVFAWEDRQVGEVMVPIEKIHSVPRNMPAADLIRFVGANPFTRIPVYEGSPGNFVGFIHAREAIAAHLNGQLRSIDDVMRDGFTVRDSLPLDRLLSQMRALRSHMAFVCDLAGDGRGIVTLDDLLQDFFGRLPDEIQVAAGVLRAPRRVAEPAMPPREPGS